MKKIELENQIKETIINALDLEDLTINDIDTDAPLFGDGLGLDSIDALELGMALKKQFDLTFQSEQKENKKHFYSVATLVQFIADTKGINLES